MTPVQRNLQEMAASIVALKLDKDDEHTVASPELTALMEQGLHHVLLPQTLQPKAAEAFQLAFEAMGGLPRLTLWADRYPASFYKLYARMIAATAAPILPDPPARNVEQWPEWLSARRLAYQESRDVAEDIASRPVDPEDNI